MVSVIEVDGLGKAYRGRRGSPRLALDGFDMVVEAGEVHGFLGPNGSGKTTTLRILLSLPRADRGELRLLGRPLPALGRPAVSQLFNPRRFRPRRNGRRSNGCEG